jgi:hypothetical protein
MSESERLSWASGLLHRYSKTRAGPLVNARSPAGFALLSVIGTNPAGSVEIVSGEYGNPGSTLYPDASSGLVRSDRGNSVGSVHLPVNPPMLLMLAKRIGELPAGQTWIFEPKSDGFRALIFRDREKSLFRAAMRNR